MEISNITFENDLVGGVKPANYFSNLEVKYFWNETAV